MLVALIAIGTTSTPKRSYRAVELIVLRLLILTKVPKKSVKCTLSSHLAFRPAKSKPIMYCYTHVSSKLTEYIVISAIIVTIFSFYLKTNGEH